MYKQSLKIFEEMGNKYGIASVMHELGKIYFQREFSGIDKALFEGSFRLKEELGDKGGIALTLHALGNSYYRDGKFNEALKMYKKSLEINEELGYRSGIVTTLHQLIYIDRNWGEFEETNVKVQNMYDQALKTFKQKGDKNGTAIVFHQLGFVHQAQGDYEEAVKMYNLSLKIFKDLGDELGIALTLQALGDVHQNQGYYKEAENFYTKVRRIIKESADIENELGYKCEITKLDAFEVMKVFGVIYEDHDKYKIIEDYHPTLGAMPPDEDELEMSTTRGELSEKLEESPEETHEEIKTLTRYPNIECPDKIVLGVEFSLLVELLLKSSKSDSKGIFIEDNGLPEKLPEVKIIVFAKGFDIEGSNTKVLQVDRDNDSDLSFFLIPKELGEKQIRVDFFQHCRYLGTERRYILVTEESSVSTEVKQTKSSWAFQLNSEPRSRLPDLYIRVRLDHDDNQILSFNLFTPHQLTVNSQTGQEIGYSQAEFGQVSLKVPPEEKIKAVYNEMSRMAHETKVDSERRIAAIGNELWNELIPEDLKREYWQFKDHVKSIQIISDEPWIPWEMIKPYRYINGKREDDLFLCQKFELSRWLACGGPSDNLSTGVARPIAPVKVDLDAVREEITFIEKLSNLNPSITGLTPFSDKIQVLDFIENGTFSLLHFATHGGFDATLPNNSAILLSGGFLRPSDIHTCFGFQRPRPLVFINACEGAQMGFSFTGLGGWANKMVSEAQVGAFAGAMWEVHDALALKFAKSFYTSLLQEGKTIAQAFRIARETVREADPSNSTWLSYVLYADPEARARTIAIPPTLDQD